ncbi:trypsin-like peptidase domain-containing protein [Paracoccaceae bacterium]|nr:trypsin-like peptidase domain-containing protein [Paracoccaceae bacterium]
MKNLSLTFCLTIAALFGSVGSGFASDLPDCPEYRHPTKSPWMNCFGSFTYPKGSKYVGEFVDDKQHGQGTWTHPDGEKYVGEFKNDKRNGQGTTTWASGNKYVGEYRDNKRTGQGTYTFANGNKYVGEYKDDKRNGQGTYTYASGDKYVGEYRDAKRNGQGTYTFADGSKDVGEFKDGLLNGFATEYSSDGSILKEGIWKDDEFQYAQKLSPPVPVAKTPTQDDEIISASDFPDCPEYRHPTKSPWINCFGTFTWSVGDKYVGEFKDDEPHGQGTVTFANGNKYVGEFRDGKRNGQGTFTFANGDKYVGEFKDDKINGQGTYTYIKSGNKYVGDFKDDNRHGQGTYTWTSGNKYVGEYKDNKRNGQGTYTYADGTVKEGIFKDNEFQYAKKLSPPVPVVKAPTQDDEIISASSGSGFAVSSDGYVITNHHVIEGCQKVVVHTKEKDLTVRVITYDPQNDLALLKGDFRPKTVFPLSSNRPELLQDIYVAGYPFGNKISTSVKVTRGIISSLTGIGNNFSNIQIDAALQPGNSGGPIIDEMGNIVGVAVAKLDIKKILDDYGVIPEDTNFGIKSNVVRSILDSNEVDGPPANQSEISKSKLGKMISNGTYYISCWMTMAQIEKMKTKKVFFSNLD